MPRWRPVVLLAAGSWLALAVELGWEALSGPVSLAPYHLLQFALVAVGFAGCFAWLAGWAGWRALLAGAAAVYLAAFLVRLFVLYVLKFMETDALPVALWNTFIAQWMLIVHFIADGWLASAILVLFYEWLIPLSQALVLAAILLRAR